MGCDIHVCLEKKVNIDGADRWINIDPHIWCKHENELIKNDVYRGRNYELFAAIANVRNGAGNVHVEPKGMPDDCHKITKDCAELWGGDGHSHSHLTVSELKEINEAFGGKAKRSGMISLEAFHGLAKGEKPTEWCQLTNNTGYVHAEWEDEYSPVGGFVDQIEKYIKFAYYDFEIEAVGDDGFRVVFWFDN
ncbi:MAG: hypothetical protein GY862_27070 [Gammaproteobacteria bacterium]|nr:hypothetical protein [Gammaproteobacteria bacterium]MCP5013857.1 hypothetical protein [Ketobacter sp.]